MYNDSIKIWPKGKLQSWTLSLKFRLACREVHLLVWSIEEPKPLLSLVYFSVPKGVLLLYRAVAYLKCVTLNIAVPFVLV